MKRITLISIVCLLLFSMGLGAQTITDSDYLKNTLNLIADKTLKAYNHQDYIAFFNYYSNSLAQFKNKNYFDNLFVAVYKDNFGDIVSKKILSEKSSLDPDYPRLVYRAICTKCKNVLITVNFQKESNTYRIKRITFDRIPQI
ncbi:MAG: hypothetical protein K9L84_03155 [Candidatus Omnitrophica bacterium]|nr:hypothetical protein [Candidatus Omnitrophota bacterium]MCF7894038.1 hypothetical protein [Candidatus Omnitrophota bacterium]